MLKWTRIRRWLKQPWAAYTFAICSGVVLFLFLSHISLLWNFFKAFIHIVFPVLIGIVIAYVLDPLVKFFENKLFSKVRRPTAKKGCAVVLTFALIVLALSVFLIAMIPQLISSVRMFISNLSGYARSLNSMLKSLQNFAAQYKVDISGFISSAGDVIGIVTNNLPQGVNKILNTTINYGVEIFNLIISFIIAIYMLMDKERLLRGGKRLWKAITNEKSYQLSTDFLGKCNSIMMQYIVFDLLDGLLIGVLNAIFMLIVGYPYVPLISVIVGVTNLAPTFGPILGAIIGSLILFLINPWYALGFLIFTIALQTVDGYVIKPKLFGGQLGIPSIWILIALIVFGRLWGVIGILLAIPFAAIIDFIYQDVILIRLERRKKKIAADEAAAKESAKVSPARSQQPGSDDPD
ncbi:MAG TPA: AI-2E family transporter [Lachnospiraceae bacterium]|nr:AI-2E family transporter [Lachnospiraceae bacterium]